MSTLYIRFPSKAAAEQLAPDAGFDCAFAQASNDGAVEREGALPLAEMGSMIAAADRVVALLAASDVTLLQTQVPPMSAARLKAALPNLVEEQLMSDPADCIMVAGPATEGERLVAVANRAWLEKIVQTLLGLGARSIAALPIQLCLPVEPETVTAAVAESVTSLDMELALRRGEQDGMGLSMLPEEPGSAPQEVLQTLTMLAPGAAIALYVPQPRVPAYQAAAAEAGQTERIQVFAENWPRWIAGAKAAPVNLAAGMGAAAGPSLHLKQWRWPLALVGLVLLVNIIGMNVEWLRMKREANALRAGMIRTYKTAYPNETAILDPIAQMRQKIAAAQNQSGQLAPDDFIALAAHFGDAWETATQGRQPPAVAALEYNERSLQVKLKPGGEPPLAAMQTALAARNLSLTQQAADTWLIRSTK